jgi:hypothetical protein
MSVSQTYDNYAQLAGTLNGYLGNEMALWAIIGALTENFAPYFYVMAYSITLLVLGWQMLRLDMRGAWMAFVVLGAVVVLSAPVQVSVPKVSGETVRQQGPVAALAAAQPGGGGMRFGRCEGAEGCVTLPWAFYVVNSVSTWAMQEGMAGVDRVIGSAGSEPGSFGALSYQLVNRDDRLDTLLRGSGLEGALRVYQDVCPRVTQETDPFWQGDARIRPLTAEELAAVGLGEDKKWPMGKVDTAAQERALRELAKWPRSGFSMELPRDARNWYPRFKIESRAYWLGAVGDSKQAAAYLAAPADLRTTKYGDEADTGRPEYFYPNNCADLHKTIQLGIDEFRSAADLRNAKMRAERKVSESYDSAGLKSSTALASAIWSLQGSQDGSGFMGFLSKIPVLGSLANLPEKGIVLGVAKIVQTVVEFVGKWIVVFMPALAALAVVFAAIYYPIVCLLALLPGQLARIGSVFWFVVWIKLSLLMVYTSLKVAGAVSLELARGELANMEGSFAHGLMVAMTVGGMILAWKSPAWARAIVFDDKHGLAHNVSRFGRGVVQGAMMTAARPAAGVAMKVAGTAASGATKLALKGVRPLTQPTAGAASWAYSAGQTTAKHVLDRIGRMRGK